MCSDGHGLQIDRPDDFFERALVSFDLCFETFDPGDEFVGLVLCGLLPSLQPVLDRGPRPEHEHFAHGLVEVDLAGGELIEFAEGECRLSGHADLAGQLGATPGQLSGDVPRLALELRQDLHS